MYYIDTLYEILFFIVYKLFHFNQLNPKIQLFPRHLMISIKRNIFLILSRHCNFSILLIFRDVIVHLIVIIFPPLPSGKSFIRML